MGWGYGGDREGWWWRKQSNKLNYTLLSREEVTMSEEKYRKMRTAGEGCQAAVFTRGVTEVNSEQGLQGVKASSKEDV